MQQLTKAEILAGSGVRAAAEGRSRGGAAAVGLDLGGLLLRPCAGRAPRFSPFLFLVQLSACLCCFLCFFWVGGGGVGVELGGKGSWNLLQGVSWRPLLRESEFFSRRRVLDC